MSHTSKDLLWNCYEIMTKELDEIYRELSKKDLEHSSTRSSRYYPRPMTERMNLIITLLELQTLIELKQNKTGEPHVNPQCYKT